MHFKILLLLLVVLNGHADDLCVTTLRDHLSDMSWKEVSPPITRSSLSHSELDTFVARLERVSEFQCLSNGCDSRAELIAYQLQRELSVNSSLLTLTPKGGFGVNQITTFPTFPAHGRIYNYHVVVVVPVEEAGHTVEYVIDFPVYSKAIEYTKWAQRNAAGIRNRIQKEDYQENPKWQRSRLLSNIWHSKIQAAEFHNEERLIRRGRRVEKLLEENEDFREAWENPYFRNFFLQESTIPIDSKANFNWRSLFEEVLRNERIAAILWAAVPSYSKNKVGLASDLMNPAFYHQNQENLLKVNRLNLDSFPQAKAPSRKELFITLGLNSHIAIPRKITAAKAGMSQAERMALFADFFKVRIFDAHIQVALEKAMNPELSQDQRQELLLTAGIDSMSTIAILNSQLLELNVATP